MEGDAAHRCSVCGEGVTPASSRLVLACAKHIPGKRWNTAFKIRPAAEEESDEIRHLVVGFWGHEDLRAFGRDFPIHSQTNLVADIGGAIAGLVSVESGNEDGIIVALGVPPLYQSLGIGSALLSAAIQRLSADGARRIRVSTTNDNLPALALYQRRGFVVDEVLPGEIGRYLEDRLGAVPTGFAGIPVRDEIRLGYSG
jgi:ribosomal protein S18 acetylase RimI-like enzyme